MTVLVSDSFNRADNTTTLGTTDSYNGGSPLTWQYRNGSVFGISSNTAVTKSGNNPVIAYVDVGQSDVKVNVTAVSSSISDYFMALLRYDPATNTGLLLGGNPIKIQSFSGSTYTNIATTSLYNAANDVFQVVLSGSTITVYRNGTQVVQGTSTINQTKTCHGLIDWRSTNNGWDNFYIEDLNTGGTNSSVTSVIANANASSLSPTVSTSSSVSALVSSVVASSTANVINPTVIASKNNTITSVVANATASGLIPQMETSLQVNINSVVANSNANAINPVITTNKNVNVMSISGTSNASALSPQVGSFTNVYLNIASANASANVNTPNISTNRNMNLGVPISNAVAGVLIPSIGLSKSTQIASVITSLVVDGIAPSITTSKGIKIDSVAASGNVSAIQPSIQTDAIIFPSIAGSQAIGIPIYIGEKYVQIIQIAINIPRKETIEANINRKSSIKINI